MHTLQITQQLTFLITFIVFYALPDLHLISNTLIARPSWFITAHSYYSTQLLWKVCILQKVRHIRHYVFHFGTLSFVYSFIFFLRNSLQFIFYLKSYFKYTFFSKYLYPSTIFTFPTNVLQILIIGCNFNSWFYCKVYANQYPCLIYYALSHHCSGTLPPYNYYSYLIC